MVIRSTIYSLITLMPYSDRIPDPVLGILRTSTDIGENNSGEEIFAETAADAPPSPRQLLHSRLLDRRSQIQASDSGSATLGGNESEATDSTMDYNHNAVMQKYLEDQNCKFVELIDKNLDAVLQQQNQFEEDTFWKGLIFDMSQYALTNDSRFKATTIVGRVMRYGWSFVPFSDDGSHLTPQQVEREKRQTQLQEILGPLDDTMKGELLRQLYVDLRFLDQVKLRDISHPEDHPESFLAQMELLAILWVRLWFAGIRLFTPKAKSLYTKFKADELLFFNSKNFDRAIMAAIRAMELVDEKLQVVSEGTPSDIINLHTPIPEYGHSQTPRNVEFPIGSGSIGPDKRVLEVGGRPSLFEVAQQFASEIS